MQITGTTFTGCTLGPYYDPNIFVGDIFTFTLTANTGFYDFYNPNAAILTLAGNTIFYDFYNPNTATFTLTKGPEQ